MTPPDSITRTWIDWTPAASLVRGPYITLPFARREVDLNDATPTSYPTALHTENDSEKAQVLEPPKTTAVPEAYASFLNPGPMIPTLTDSFPALVTKAAIAEAIVTKSAVVPDVEGDEWPGYGDGGMLRGPRFTTIRTRSFRRPITSARVVKSAGSED
jgi:hypothetical protein